MRTLLLGEKGLASRVEGIALYNFTVCYGDAEKARFIRSLHPINKFALAPEHGFSLFVTSMLSIPPVRVSALQAVLMYTVQEVKDPNKPEDWIFQLIITWDSNDPEHEKLNIGEEAALAKLKEIGKGFAEPWKSALLYLPDDQELKFNNVAYWISIPWDNHGGKITLAGDAAHPMPPRELKARPYLQVKMLIRIEDRGQGLNNCVADVSSLLKALKDVANGSAELGSAISAYDAEVVERGSKEVATSRMSAIMLHDFEKFMSAPIFKKGYAKN